MRQRRPHGEHAVSISVASRITGVEVHTLRYWEKEFPQYLHPLRTPGGQRRYRPEDIANILQIRKLLKDEMFSIAGARRVLRRESDRKHPEAA